MDMNFEKIQISSPTVPELVLDSLLKAIESGRIQVGRELPPERDLAEALGISRNSLRECLSILNFMGLVENRGNRKVLVKNADYFRKARSLLELSYSADTFEDFMEFRRTNEREIARLACRRATEEDLERLRVSVERLEKDATDYLADVEFHVNLAYASHNTIFAAMLDFVNSLILELRMRFFEREHDLLFRCVRTRQPDVVEDRTFQEPAVLKYIGYGVHQLFLGNVFHINAADLYRSFVHIPKACDKPRGCGLAAARRSDKSK